jgi:muramoyltetrapeptide carboxypeptidase
MQTSRRNFLALAGATGVALGWHVEAERPPAIVKPPRLKAGDTVGLITPSGGTYSSIDIDIVRDTMEALGLKVRVGPHVLARYGNMAGPDADRAADVNAMLRDPAVRGLVCIRGGWGGARILPLLDYGALRADPKVLLGYSDITALHMAVHAMTGLVTFHGPVGISKWNAFNVDWLKRVVFDGEAVTFENDKSFDVEETLVQRENRIRTLTPGTARGRLVGGNLSVFATIIGSPYVPDLSNRILFLEDTKEAPYRIDRMITQLQLAGLLSRVRAFIWGTCSQCDPGEGFGSLTIEDVLHDHITPLGVPAWYGAMIGHVEKQFTLPIGVEVEVDAERGSIRMLEPAVR